MEKDNKQDEMTQFLTSLSGINEDDIINQGHTKIVYLNDGENQWYKIMSQLDNSNAVHFNFNSSINTDELMSNSYDGIFHIDLIYDLNNLEAKIVIYKNN